jgi:hypothetical protein
VDHGGLAGCGRLMPRHDLLDRERSRPDHLDAFADVLAGRLRRIHASGKRRHARELHHERRRGSDVL